MNPCILSYTCLSLEWKASSFLLLSLKGGLVFWLTFFFLLRCLMFKREVCSVKDVWQPTITIPNGLETWRLKEIVGRKKEANTLGLLGRFFSRLCTHELLICSVSQWSHVTHFPCLVLRHPRLCFHLGVTMHLQSQTFVCCEIKTKGLCPREVPLSKAYLEVPPPYEAAVRLVPESAF